MLASFSIASAISAALSAMWSVCWNVNADIAVPDPHVGDETFRGNGVVQILWDDDDERRQHQHSQHGERKGFCEREHL